MPRLKTTIKALFSIGLILWLVKRFDWQTFFKIIIAVDFKWLLPLVIIGPLTVIFLSLRWSVILKALGLPLKFWVVIKGVWSGIFFNTFLPGATGGDIYRFIFLREVYAGEEAKITSSLVLDRVTGIIALGILGSVGLLVNKSLLCQIGIMGAEFKVVTVLSVLFILFSLFIGVWIMISKLDSTLWLIKFKKFILESMTHSKLGLFNYLLFAKVIAISVITHLVNFITAYCLTRALGLDISFLELVIFMPVLSLLTALPITISGFGIREALLIGFFQIRGFHLGGGERESALAFSFLMVALDLLKAAPGGIWFVFLNKSKQSPILKHP